MCLEDKLRLKCFVGLEHVFLGLPWAVCLRNVCFNCEVCVLITNPLLEEFIIHAVTEGRGGMCCHHPLVQPLAFHLRVLKCSHYAKIT